MSVLSQHMAMKRAMGKEPGRLEVAESLKLTSKSVVSHHLKKLEQGGLITLGRRGVVSLTTEGLVILSVYERGGAIA